MKKETSEKNTQASSKNTKLNGNESRDIIMFFKGYKGCLQEVQKQLKVLEIQYEEIIRQCDRRIEDGT